ncbi:MAG TPA: Gfo/Idh/MocA family oxidoreductase [Gemmatimonadota bacterium]|nr:Gfo/Idh/MocA family oxidoreductase [Gemmatimonadota bacterium]
MRVGVIGTGRIGRYHARVVGAHPDVEALLVSDVDAARALDVATELGAEAVDSAEHLLGKVDALVIASSTDTHAHLIHAAVDAGIPAFCEKPIALDLPSASAVVRHVKEADGVVQVGFQRRFDAGYSAARRMVQDGSLGTVYVIRVAGHDAVPPHESYIPGSGGMFRDLHIHDFDVARWILGQEVSEVYATGAVLCDPMFAKYGDVDTTAATLMFDGGTLGVVTGTRHDARGYDVRIELFGSSDTVSAGWDGRTPLRSLEPGMPPPPEHPYDGFLDRFDAAYRHELNAFVDLAHNRIPNPCTVEDAEIALRVALACERSRAEHRPVAVAEIGE